MKQNAADTIVRRLTDAGVERLYAYPGDPIIEMMERSRVAGIDVVLARREGSAAFMAEGEAALTGRVGACLSTLGPGSTALVNGVAAATLDRVPMLAISGQIDRARLPFFTHQVIDHEALFRPVTKWATTVDGGSVDVVTRKALRVATAERPGAVHLSCSEDTFAAEVPQDYWPPLDASVTQPSISVRSDGQTIGGLLGSGKPIILAGIGAMRAGAAAELRTLAEKLGAPVVVSPMAKGVFPESHDLFAGVLDMACNDVVWEFVATADLIIAAGFDGVELIKPWQLRTPVLHVDALPNTDQIWASGAEVIGHVGAGLTWLADEFRGEQRWDIRTISAHRINLTNEYTSGRKRGVLNPTDVVSTLQDALSDDVIATTDVGSHKLLMGQGWRCDEPRRLLMTNGLSSMGFGVPAAIGVASAQTKPVVAVVGDGGFAMTATELRLAAERQLNLVVVVLVDNSLNRIELKQSARGYPSVATRIESMDLVAFGQAVDCDAVRVTTTDELETAVSYHSPTRPLIIQAEIDPAQYVAQF